MDGELCGARGITNQNEKMKNGERVRNNIKII